jgi:spermidine synthase
VEAGKRKILSNKVFLYMTEFFSGVCVMAVEQGASRLLAPYFSSSQIVWTIIIGMIMIAMALGNIYGGRAVDKDPNPDKLYGRILIAAVWTALIPLLGKYVILGVSALMIVAVSTNLLIWAAFVSCLVIFVYPLFLLGTVTPSLIKYTVDDLNESGRIAGRLGAANTIGSILGTFVPTFVTIPAAGTSATFLIFSGILMALCLVYFASSKTGKKRVAAAVAVFLVSCTFGHSDSFAFWDKNLTYEGESIYNYLQVREDSNTVSLSTNVLFGVQSITMKDHSLSGMYYDYAMAAPLMANVNNHDHCDVLVLGNGTGTYASQCERYFDNVTAEGVEIDGKIIGLASEYFDQPAGMQVTEYDGRAFLNAVGKKYDVIMVDAFRDITIPFQMSTQEFFSEVRDHLNDGGVMAVNLNMRGDENDPDDINHYLSDTISTVFDHIYTVDVPDYTNRVLFATNAADAKTVFADNVAKENRQDLRTLMNTVQDQLQTYTPGTHVMTDDKAPVELLGMRQIDAIIREQVGYYRDLLLSGQLEL